MTARTRNGGIAILVTVAGMATGVLLLAQHGFSARDQPTAIEAFVARRLRHLAMPRSARERLNPIRATPDILAEARVHFADHCAICHANDGSGDIEIGKNLYPKAPDMRQSTTQSLSDGELFFIIHNGIRFTGMPAWGNDSVAEDQDSWKLVHFIRRLPHITQEELEEMKKMNPKGPHEIQEEEAIREFLTGDDRDMPSRGQHHEEENR